MALNFLYKLYNIRENSNKQCPIWQKRPIYVTKTFNDGLVLKNAKLSRKQNAGEKRQKMSATARLVIAKSYVTQLFTKLAFPVNTFSMQDLFRICIEQYKGNRGICVQTNLGNQIIFKVCLTKSADLSVFVLFFLFKVCLTQSADLSVFVLFFLFKVCQTQSADLSVFVLFFLFFILFYFSLQPPASLDFSVISQPISMKFGMLIVLDETNRLNIFSSQ